MIYLSFFKMTSWENLCLLIFITSVPINRGSISSYLLAMNIQVIPIRWSSSISSYSSDLAKYLSISCTERKKVYSFILYICKISYIQSTIRVRFYSLILCLPRKLFSSLHWLNPSGPRPPFFISSLRIVSSISGPCSLIKSQCSSRMMEAFLVLLRFIDEKLEKSLILLNRLLCYSSYLTADCDL